MRKKSKKVIGVSVLLSMLLVMSGCASQVKLPDLSSMGDVFTVAREEGSGTRAEFENQIKTDDSGIDAIAASTDEMVFQVESDKNAIGYIAYSSYKDSDKTKVVALDGVLPDKTSIQKGKYPLCRNYSLAYGKKLSDVENDFMTYILSAGQKLVSDYALAVGKESSFLSDKSKGTITIYGSTSVAPLMQALAGDYQTYNPNAKITIEASDSTTGLTDAMQGKCSFAMSSRELKAYEKELLTTKVIAKDAIAVIVNKENPVTDLSKEHIQKIYDNEVKAWSELK